MTDLLPDPWATFRALTPARIGLGVTGVSQPTAAHLAFQLARARARDAVHYPLDTARLVRRLEDAGRRVVRVQSAASDRATYLRRPDLGRRLDEPSRGALEAELPGAPADVLFVLADGLSALAVERHAPPLLARILAHAEPAGWRVGPVVVATGGRVALGDEIGACLGAAQVVVLIGERPGLSSPDSLGAYLTWNPRVGRTDAERNCVSNVRPDGLDVDTAAARLWYLLREARRRALSGVELKEESELLRDGEEPAIGSESE